MAHLTTACSRMHAWASFKAPRPTALRTGSMRQRKKTFRNVPTAPRHRSHCAVADTQLSLIEPNRRIVEGVRARVPDAPIIGFPRGAAGMIRSYAEQVGVNMLGLDYSMPLDFARTIVPQGLGVQGNLDPLRLVAGGAQMRERTEAIVAAFADRPHIFNLGHGIVPQTPIAHVAELVDLVVNR